MTVRVIGRRLTEPSFAFLLNVPALLAIVLLVGYPIVYSAWLSLHHYNLKRPRLFRFVGLENYAGILRSEEFWTALQVTLLFTAVSVVIVVVLATLIALLLNESFPARGLVRTLVLIPWAIPPVVNGLMWQWIYALVATAPSQDTRRAFVRGFLSNVLNPKVALFYLTLLPQFVRPEDNVLARSLVLAGVHVVIGLIWLVSYAYFFSRVSDVLRRPRMRRALEGVTGALLIGFGGRLVCERR